MRRPSPRTVLGTLFLTVFLDLVGFGIVIPVFAPLFLGPQSPFFESITSATQRGILYGVLLAAFPVAQFFGAPMLGALADRHGRRPMLLLSVAGTGIGYLLAGWAVMTHSFWLLFASRIIDGFTGGNISVAQSAIADVSDAQSKTRNFGLIGMAFGLGFVLGPFLGGILSDPTIHPLFNQATPFWFAAILSVVTLVCIALLLPETLHTRIRSEVSWMTGMRNVVKAFQLPELRVILLVGFLLMLGFTFFTQFFQVFLVQRFGFVEHDIGNTFAYVGLWIAGAQGFITRPLSRRFTPEQTLRVSILLLGCTLPLLVLPTHAWWLYGILPFVAIFQGLTQPNITSVVSNVTGKESQGEALGINQSLQSLAMTLPPLIAGGLAARHSEIPIILGGLVTIVGWAVYIVFFRMPLHKRFHEA